MIDTDFEHATSAAISSEKIEEMEDEITGLVDLVVSGGPKFIRLYNILLKYRTAEMKDEAYAKFRIAGDILDEFNGLDSGISTAEQKIQYGIFCQKDREDL